MPKKPTEEEVLNGGPGEEPGEDLPKKKKNDPPNKDIKTVDPISLLAEQVKSLAEDVRQIRKNPPKAKEDTSPKKPKEEDEPNWETLMFEKPGEAARLIRDGAAKEAEDKLRKEYQADQKRRDFWNGFYKDNPDLKDDDDIVQLTMTQNLEELQDMPVEKAAVRIAELTRERILRYSKGNNKVQKKVEVEGASSPKPGEQDNEEDDVKITSISDLIKRRRELRRKSGRIAAA